MSSRFVVLCGMTVLMMTPLASAETRIVLDDADSGRVGGRFLYGQFLGWDFALQQDGSWSTQAPNITNGAEVVKSLATGKIAGFTPGKWHHLAVSLKDSDMLVTVDGKEVARVQNEGYPGRKNGMAYLMSSYDLNCFDNVVVTQ